MRAVVWDNERKGFDISHAVGSFLINNVKCDFERGF